jgi:Fungal specific transcription factor domain
VTGFETNEVREIFEKCRRITRAVKAKLPTELDIGTNFKDQVPPRAMADQLVDLYFRTHESIHRILHIPSFRKEYVDFWNYPERTNPIFVVKLLLIMAIGTCFYQGDGEEDIRASARKWVISSQSWASALFDKEQLNLSTIQINCLLLLARQTNSVGVDLIWIPTGNLLRIAFSMGFHRDPKHFPKLPLFVAEMRRRIWATVLEMTIQNSIDLGMPPLISSNDFDTEPPSNIDDEDISESTTVIPIPKSQNVFTQSSIQIALCKSLRIRLGIVHFVNSFHSEPSYDEVLRLGQEISKACNEASRLIQSYPAHLPRPTAFQTSLLEIYTRRFVLEVHRPFFVRSQTDPRYYFSRKVCLENALEIFSHSGAEDLPTDHGPHVRDDYESLKTVGGGLFKTVFFHAITIVTVE